MVTELLSMEKNGLPAHVLLVHVVVVVLPLTALAAVLRERLARGPAQADLPVRPAGGRSLCR